MDKILCDPTSGLPFIYMPGFSGFEEIICKGAT